ncbi:MAG: RagB/SusD family nutrient uptake outer membrane protein, partial [Ferruginibacter sp.]|nr:RagB/SusD family nutrient uptake outer membrane protein [Cytophagales bacterium]
LPLLDGSYTSPANELKTDQGIASKDPFTPDAGNLDPRLDHSIGRRGLPFLDWQPHPGFDWIRDQSFAGPYTQKKLSYYKADRGKYQDGSSWTPGYQSINFMFVRFADVLLLAAEAEVEVGSLAKALEYVNLVRARAANSAGFLTLADGTPAAKYVITPYPAFASQDFARQAVRFERKLELALEGHRFFDLSRWGIAEQTLNAYFAYEGAKLTTNLGGARFTPNQDELLPIPQRQIDFQGADVLKQNPGY